MLRTRSYSVVQKVSFRVPGRTKVFIWENCHPGNREFGRKNRDLGNRVSPASHMNTSKERVARRELGNRASPVDRARMKFWVFSIKRATAANFRIFI